MRRIFLIMSVAGLMVAMMGAAALPAIAAPGNGAKHVSFGDDNTSGKAVFTPSGVANATSHEHPKGGNRGGTGGGGAQVGNATTFIVIAPGPGDQGTLVDTEAHSASTPSGNGMVQGHSKI